ncbi:hypothetical protein PENTCL1PPCAC_30073, partial [Pristionchus entomophagus]
EVKNEELDDEYKPNIDDIPLFQEFESASTSQTITDELKPELVDCQQCGERLVKDDYRDHVMSCQPELAKRLYRYCCPHCKQQKFPTNQELLAHYNVCPHWNAPTDWLRTDANSAFLTMSQKVYCPLCARLCNTFFYLSAHLQNHERQRSQKSFFKCMGCSGTFKNAYNLKEHLVRAAQSVTHSHPCRNSAMVIEVDEAKQWTNVSKTRFFPIKLDTRAHTSNNSTNHFHRVPEIQGSEVCTKRSRTIRDAEYMETRRSIVDARLKVRYDSTGFMPFPVAHLPTMSSHFGPRGIDCNPRMELGNDHYSSSAKMGPSAPKLRKTMTGHPLRLRG